jgi:hypothetical protein
MSPLQTHANPSGPSWSAHRRPQGFSWAFSGMPFAGVWRVTEWPLDRPLPALAGMSANESLESVGALQGLPGGQDSEDALTPNGVWLICHDDPPTNSGPITLRCPKLPF